MKFGAFPIDTAENVILAHTFRRGGITLKKGHEITRADIEALKKIGVTEITGAWLEQGDIAENDAAAKVASCIAGSGVRLSEAHTGRCNLEAEAGGLVLVDEKAIIAANQIDEAVTVATLRDKDAVRAGQTIATVKIIPFAISPVTMNRIEAAMARPAVRVIPYRAKTFALINTTLPGLKPSVIASTTEVTRERVAAVGGSLVAIEACAHDTASTTAAIKAVTAKGADVVLIAGASATVDRGDVVPAAIVQAGGVIDHFGMPVDPGNLLVLGHIEASPVLVLPGCARSPKLNGLDWVLQRIAANVPVAREDIMAMGAGGLLVDTPARPLPRDTAVKKVLTPHAPRVTAVILAAGQSRRMGGPNKLLMTVDGKPLVRKTVETLQAAGLADIIVVVGHQEAEVRAALAGTPVRFAPNPHFAEGLSTSLKAGLSQVPDAAEAMLVCLGDMPALHTRHIAGLLAGFDAGADKLIGVPTHIGKRGNPTLWARRFFDDMRQVSGDAGAKHLIGANESLVYEVEFDDTGVLTDLDTAEQWQAFRAAHTQS
ncbi:MAG: molybdopterin-binding/glycosyltransferase family 2 protein [Rhodospirillaceae bacterium]|nr:molybdopterin-binding/glycosyltransferase family 2 protein [Rhodospirillaceae bacterium]